MLGSPPPGYEANTAPCRHWGGVNRSLWLDPPLKKAQLTGPPKTDKGTSMVPMAVFKDTRPPVTSG